MVASFIEPLGLFLDLLFGFLFLHTLSWFLLCVLLGVHAFAHSFFLLVWVMLQLSNLQNFFSS